MNKLDFEVLVTLKILDRNSQICFHNPMIKATDKKVTWHGLVHALCPNNTVMAASATNNF